MTGPKYSDITLYINLDFVVRPKLFTAIPLIVSHDVYTYVIGHYVITARALPVNEGLKRQF